MKLMEILGKAKDYIGRAIKFLGKLLGIVKGAEEALNQEEDKPEEKAGE
jgi:hypothetical protein